MNTAELFRLQEMFQFRTDTVSPVKTETDISRDLENLYITVKCYEPENVNTASSGNAYAVWQGDNLEVMLGNMGDHPWYRHFVLGAGGGRHSIYAGLNDWLGRVTALEDHYWEAEFVIPFRLLGKFDRTLRFNLLRQRTGELQTASKIEYGHDVELFLEFPIDLPDDYIKHGPWIFQVSTDSASIGWETIGECESKLEIRKQGDTEYDTVTEYAVSDNRKLRRVHLKDLEPDTVYEYRIGYADGEFRTMKAETADFSFLLLADTHDDAVRFSQIIQRPEIQDCDFAVYLGDMLTSSLDRSLYYDAFLDSSVKYWKKPFHYMRGNHEFRGCGKGAFRELFGRGHYVFHHGGVMFITFEVQGDLPLEAKRRWDEEQESFLKTLIETPEFKNARNRIVLSHVAPLMADDSEAHAAEKVFRHFPAGSIDLFLSGHKHSYSYIAPGADKIESLNVKRFGGRPAMVHDYPLLVAHYGGFMRVERKGNTLTVHTWNECDQKLDEKQFPLK